MIIIYTEIYGISWGKKNDVHVFFFLNWSNWHQVFLEFFFCFHSQSCSWHPPPTLSWGFRIHQLHLCRWGKPHRHPNKYPGNEIKAFDGVAPALEFWGMLHTPSLPLLPSPLWPGEREYLYLIYGECCILLHCPYSLVHSDLERVPLCILSMGQLEISNHLLFLKPFNCMQMNKYTE